MEKKKSIIVLTYDGNKYEIGRCFDVQKRLSQISDLNPENKVICYGDRVSLKYLREVFYKCRIDNTDSFDLSDEQVTKAIRLITKGESGRRKGSSNETKIVSYVSRSASPVVFEARKKSTRYKLSDHETKKIVDGIRKWEEKSKEYVIDFGKYKGTKIGDMISDEQMSYCVWLHSQLHSQLSKNGRKTNRLYRSLAWRIKFSE